MVEFLAQWIRDEGLRRKVLFREQTAMQDWGLEQTQIDDLISLDSDDILAKLREELEDGLGIDLDQVLSDITSTGGMGTGGGAAYQEGKAHVRGVEPAKITRNLESIVIVRGHGYDDTVEAHFVP